MRKIEHAFIMTPHSGSAFTSLHEGSMRIQSEDKELLLEKTSARAVERLAPDEAPVFSDLYKASLRTSSNRPKSDFFGSEDEPGFFLWGETVVWTPGIVNAGRLLLEGLLKRVSGAKDDDASLAHRVSKILKETGKEDILRLRENAVKKAAQAGLTKEEASLAVDAFLKALCEA